MEIAKTGSLSGLTRDLLLLTACTLPTACGGSEIAAPNFASRELRLRERLEEKYITAATIDSLRHVVSLDAKSEMDFEIAGVIIAHGADLRDLEFRPVRAPLEDRYEEVFDKFEAGDNSMLGPIIELVRAYVGDAPGRDTTQTVPMNTLEIGQGVVENLLAYQAQLEKQPDCLRPIQRRAVIDLVRFNIVSNMNLGRSNIEGYLTDPNCLGDFHIHTHNAPPSPRDEGHHTAPSIVLSYRDAWSPEATIFLTRDSGYTKLATFQLE